MRLLRQLRRSFNTITYYILHTTYYILHTTYYYMLHRYVVVVFERYYIACCCIFSERAKNTAYAYGIGCCANWARLRILLRILCERDRLCVHIQYSVCIRHRLWRSCAYRARLRILLRTLCMCERVCVHIQYFECIRHRLWRNCANWARPCSGCRLSRVRS